MLSRVPRAKLKSRFPPTQNLLHAARPPFKDSLIFYSRKSTSKVDSNFGSTVRVRHFLESTSKVDTAQGLGRAASSDASSDGRRAATRVVADVLSTSKVDSNFASTVRVRHFLESTSKVDTAQAVGRAAGSDAGGGRRPVNVEG